MTVRRTPATGTRSGPSSSARIAGSGPRSPRSAGWACSWSSAGWASAGHRMRPPDQTSPPRRGWASRQRRRRRRAPRPRRPARWRPAPCHSAAIFPRYGSDPPRMIRAPYRGRAAQHRRASRPAPPSRKRDRAGARAASSCRRGRSSSSTRNGRRASCPSPWPLLPPTRRTPAQWPGCRGSSSRLAPRTSQPRQAARR
jgi:hypothetical protein